MSLNNAYDDIEIKQHAKVKYLERILDKVSLVNQWL